jgi:hypothetical protein
MTDLPKYDEAAALERNVREIHEEWKGLRDLSSSGQKAWLTQMKNHYTKIIQADAEAAAELLATHEFHSDLISKHERPTAGNNRTPRPADSSED